MGEDGSLGAWGGKKYEGLGSRNVKFLLYRNFLNLEDSKVYLSIIMLQKEKKYDLITIVHHKNRYFTLHIILKNSNASN